MSRASITLTTPDGRCEASVFRPDRGSSWPAVLVFMDGIGVRPALWAIGERIAAHGYFVLVPDLFYRAGPYTSPDPFKLFQDAELRAAWRSKFVGAATIGNAMRDTQACLEYLAAQPDVRGTAIGTTGYCMGGAWALAAAGHFPDRIAAAASFHGGHLATDAPESPHLLAPRMKARVLVAGATDDPTFPDDMKQRLEAALAAADVPHAVETWPARHGWVPTDTPTHDPAAAERHFDALFTLFDATLGEGATP